MTWRWIYAACFISTIPSLCHVHLVVLDTLLTDRGIDVDAIMPAAHSLADHYGLTSVTSHSCCPVFVFIANDQMAAVGAIYLSRAPLRVFRRQFYISLLVAWVQSAGSVCACRFRITNIGTRLFICGLQQYLTVQPQ